jgi:CarD family transcriptional regulator
LPNIGGKMYKVDDKVVYPMHGVGVIEKIEEKNILGKTKLYYIMKLSVTDMTVMVPVDMADKLGLRGVVEYDEIMKALDLLKEDPSVVEENWKARYSNNHGKVKSGSIFELAEVVRNLFRRNKVKELSTSEKKLFENALQLMVDEIALSKDLEKVEVEHLITETLEEGVPENSEVSVK